MSASTESESFFYVVGSSRALMGLFALIGNAFVLYVIFRFETLRDYFFNWLIAVLAFSDTARGIVMVQRGLREIIFTKQLDNFTKFQCLLSSTWGTVAIQWGQLATITIAIDRLMAIRNPLGHYKTKGRTSTNVLLMIFTLIYPPATAWLPFIGVDFDSMPIKCTFADSTTRAFVIYWIIVAFITALTIYGCYGVTYIILVKKQKNDNVSSQMKRQVQKQTSLFRTISLILLIYGLCWLLPTIVATIITVNKWDHLRAKMTVLVSLLSALNSCLNVLVYGWKHREISSAMRQVLGIETTPTTVITVVQTNTNINRERKGETAIKKF